MGGLTLLINLAFSWYALKWAVEIFSRPGFIGQFEGWEIVLKSEFVKVIAYCGAVDYVS